MAVAREALGLTRCLLRAAPRTSGFLGPQCCNIAGPSTLRRFTSSASSSPSLPKRLPASTSISQTGALLRNLRHKSTESTSTSKSSDLKNVKVDTSDPSPQPTSDPPSPSTTVSTPSPTQAAPPSEVTVKPSDSADVSKKNEKKEPEGIPDASSIVKLLSLAKPQWRLISVGVFCLVISTGVNLAIPWVIGRIIDYFAPGSEQTLLFGLPIEQAVGALGIVLLIGAAANAGRSVALRLSGQRTAALIR